MSDQEEKENNDNYSTLLTSEDITEHGLSFVKNTDFLSILESQSETRESIEVKENSEIIKMRKTWSTWVLFSIILIILFDIILVTFYGLGIWSFEDSTVVIVIVTENFLKIIGLGLLITLSLFKKIYT